MFSVYRACFGPHFPPKFLQRLAKRKATQERLKPLLSSFDSKGRFPSVTDPDFYSKLRTLQTISGVESEKKITKVTPIVGSVRTGLIGYKIGASAIYDDYGARHMVTLVKLSNLKVIRSKTIAQHGYESVVLGSGIKPLRKCKKVEVGVAIKMNSLPFKDIREFRVSSESLLPSGLNLSASHFVPGQWLFVAGKTQARGYLGAKRSWHMAGQPKTHGTTKGQNNAGSTGQGKSFGKVWKYKRMDGHRGTDPRTVNCKLMRIDTENEILYLKGCVPGAASALIRMGCSRSHFSQKQAYQITLPHGGQKIKRNRRRPSG
jgi:large subunit ribosomal protein L3